MELYLQIKLNQKTSKFMTFDGLSGTKIGLSFVNAEECKRMQLSIENSVNSKRNQLQAVKPVKKPKNQDISPELQAKMDAEIAKAFKGLQNFDFSK